MKYLPLFCADIYQIISLDAAGRIMQQRGWRQKKKENNKILIKSFPRRITFGINIVNIYLKKFFSWTGCPVTQQPSGIDQSLTSPGANLLFDWGLSWVDWCWRSILSRVVAALHADSYCPPTFLPLQGFQDLLRRIILAAWQHALWRGLFVVVCRIWCLPNKSETRPSSLPVFEWTFGLIQERIVFLWLP